MNKVQRTINAINEFVNSQENSHLLEKTAHNLDINVEELVMYQETKSRAQLHGLLSLEEALTLYKFIGHSCETFNNQPWQEKLAVTLILKKLAEALLGINEASKHEGN